MAVTSKVDTPNPRRRWLAVLLATIIMLASYTMFVYSLAALSGSETVFAGGLLGIALGLVPGVFIVAAFVSQNPNTPRATLTATALWVLFALPLGMFSFPIGLVAGFGAGGIVAFRRWEPHTWQSRAVAVGLCVLYVFTLQFVSLELALFSAAPLPFLAIAAADVFKEKGYDEG